MTRGYYTSRSCFKGFRSLKVNCDKWIVKRLTTSVDSATGQDWELEIRPSNLERESFEVVVGVRICRTPSLGTSLVVGARFNRGCVDLGGRVNDAATCCSGTLVQVGRKSSREGCDQKEWKKSDRIEHLEHLLERDLMGAEVSNLTVVDIEILIDEKIDGIWMGKTDKIYYFTLTLWRPGTSSLENKFWVPFRYESRSWCKAHDTNKDI